MEQVADQSMILPDAFEQNDQLLQPATVGSLEDWATAWPFDALSIHAASDRDFYLFSIETLLTQPYWLDLTFENPDLDLDLYLHRLGSDTTPELIRSSVSGMEGEPESLDLTGLEPGDYILEVLPYTSGVADSGLNSRYELRRREAEPQAPIQPIQVFLQPLGSVIDGVLQAQAIVQENIRAPLPLASRTDGLLDLTRIDRLSFGLQANLTPEQIESLQNQAPAEPIRFRIALNAAAGEQVAGLVEADLIFSVIATDPISLSPTVEIAEPIRINLTPDSAGFYEWPVFDQQARGQGFVVADLLIDAIPVNDNLQEGTEIGSFSIVDLSGAIFGSPSSSDGLAPNNSGELQIADAVGSPATPPLFNLDVDGDGRVTPLGDGLMIIRKLFGSAFPDDALTAKAISPEATRDTSAIHSYIQRGIDQGLLDVDRDGQTNPLSDGLMVIRQLFGDAFRGEALINKAISDTSSLIPQGQALSDLTPAGRLDLANLVRQEITALLPPSSSP
jgi:hypothetical protein